MNGLVPTKDVINEKLKLLNTELVGDFPVKTKFKCLICNKTWSAYINDIYNKTSLCSTCNKPLREAVCRNHMENLYGVSFPKVKDIDWLKNPSTNQNLELDGYSKDINVAFEYQGEYHYLANIDLVLPKKKSREKKLKSILKIKKIDRLKRLLCKKNGVNLLVIPHWIPDKDLGNYIEKFKTGELSDSDF